MRLITIAIIAAAVAATASVATGGPAAVTCSLWAAPYGADTNPGSQSNPFLTITKLAASLTPGQTGCLAPGTTFAAREVISAAGSGAGRVTITTAPGGARATLADGIETTQQTRFLTLMNVNVGAAVNSSRTISGTVVLRGYSVALRNSDVGPGGIKEVGRSCVVLDHANLAVVAGNVLHECNGASPGIYGAGVLAATSASARITDNVIWGLQGGDGIALSPNAQLWVVRRNIIADNQNGVYFGGDAKLASRRNVVEQNVITRASRFAIHGSWTPNGPVGTGNVVRQNCLWNPGAIPASGTGFTARANLTVNPQVVKVQGTYRLAPSSPCRAYRPRP